METTGSVSLLVKSTSAPTALGLGLGATTLQIRPLMPSVDASRRDTPLGAVSTKGAQWYQVRIPAFQGSAWDACHKIASAAGLGATGQVQFVEPDLQQQWLVSPSQPKTALAAAEDKPAEQNKNYPRIPDDDDWYRDDAHGQFRKALDALGTNFPTVRVAHLDTGYDPKHDALPRAPKLRTDLARSFVEDPPLTTAEDTSGGILNNHGHGTGTLSILAGLDPANRSNAIGAAPFVEVVPIRVANRVVLFYNSAIAKALDYVHSLCDDDATRIHVVTMSMGGVASQAWADAVNALYERGVFVVTAAGNNFANLPTHDVVYPARFRRVTAVCGAMADFKPYADLTPRLMAGNYGPASLMTEALAAYTPNTPWARFGTTDIVDHDGNGTSAATPQVAAAAAIWIANNMNAWRAYPQDWMRTEAVRGALFQAAAKQDAKHFGNGLLRARDALDVVLDKSTLTIQPKDDADWSLIRVLTGLGAAPPDNHQRMLELEAIQLTQTGGYSRLLPDTMTREALLPLARALQADARASKALQQVLAAAIGTKIGVPPKAASSSLKHPSDFIEGFKEKQRIAASSVNADKPDRRMLRVFAYDPSLGTSLDTVGINRAVLDVKWEDLSPGPIGEYLEVVDVDPASNACYAPVDLNASYILAQQGLAPSEGDPRFHQQMAYAVASRTIEFFERALGRVALWAPRLVNAPSGLEEQYVPRLRIYPHALRAANAFYSPEKRALLLGYFNAGESDPSENAPGTLVFGALSHDIVAHETTHALLDGLHRRYTEATNPDVLAFHEAFADIVALFQHFTLPEALKAQIARTRGDLGRQNLLGELAAQFGHATGNYGALRDAIGGYDENGQWRPRKPSIKDYSEARAPENYEPHSLGALLVAAVFDAFLQVYRERTRDLVRLATGGTGILGDGELPVDLVSRLAEEAAAIAGHVLEICIRALDYCPPVDVTFGEYLRALITADCDLAPDDSLGYRVAFASAFRARGIMPATVTAIAADSLSWDPPPETLTQLTQMLAGLSLHWDLRSERQTAWRVSRQNAVKVRDWLVNTLPDDELGMLGLVRHPCSMTMGNEPGKLGGIEVHSVRPARRIGPNRRSRSDLFIEITQTWRSDAPAAKTFRGGSTLIIDLDRGQASYLVRKRVDHVGRFAAQTAFQLGASLNTLRANFFDDQQTHLEPFAALHQAR
jgi:subtilisin family serine protease